MSKREHHPAKPDIYVTFTERLIFAMNIRNIKNKDLAEYLYVSASTISDYRTGYRVPNIEQLAHLSHILNVTTDFLLGLDDNYTI